MSTNFQQWNPTKSNQESDAQYTADAIRAGGAQTGDECPSPTFNKFAFQASTMVAALGALLSAFGISNSDANLSSLVEALFSGLNISASCGTSGGTANAQTLAPAVTLPAYEVGQKFRFVAGFTNTAGMTIAISGLGALAVMDAGPTGLTALVGGELVVGNEYELTVMAGPAFQLGGPSTPFQSLTNPGYLRLPGGLILQWGLSGYVPTGSNTTNFSISFPKPFPNALFIVQGSPNGPARPLSAWWPTVVIPYVTSQAGATFRVDTTELSQPITNAALSIFWFALGY